MSKSFPAMAVVGQSAGPARRPGEVLYPVRVPGSVLRFGTRPLVAFSIGYEHHMAHGAHFLFESRPMIDFQIGNERYGGPFRYLGRRAIFLTQTLRATKIWIFSTQTVRLLLFLVV